MGNQTADGGGGIGGAIIAECERIGCWKTALFGTSESSKQSAGQSSATSGACSPVASLWLFADFLSSQWHCLNSFSPIFGFLTSSFLISPQQVFET